METKKTQETEARKAARIRHETKHDISLLGIKAKNSDIAKFRQYAKDNNITLGDLFSLMVKKLK